ncbi:MAG: protein of unknown function DUF343 [Candidatus Parvarchaeum acidophilus ARMAN-5]|jgi:uncharacterized protein YbaR (Trm112 family)|uniref:Trm112 family protein n=1 Tax=Candidatus Parvarchaeum acidophilus ARMAN-5 TaxID=662762 RepID=D6GV97_PARA5|nr:MAG: protein of unknown function DUF343 [Candidatus Parvarchaeum acidophilus ARMAN-5]
MEYNLIDMIACPVCKGDSFSVIIIDKNEDYNTGYVRAVTNNKQNEEKDIKAIKNGILLCKSCERWYPIINNVYTLLPDSYRNENNDKKFLIKYKTKIPDTIINNGKPFNIKTENE